MYVCMYVYFFFLCVYVCKRVGTHQYTHTHPHTHTSLSFSRPLVFPRFSNVPPGRISDTLPSNANHVFPVGDKQYEYETALCQPTSTREELETCAGPEAMKLWAGCGDGLHGTADRNLDSQTAQCVKLFDLFRTSEKVLPF